MDVQYTIRTARAEDESAVTRLLTASFGALLRSAYDAGTVAAALPYMGRANPALLRSGKFFVADSREYGLLGCGGWSVERPGTGQIEAGLVHVRHFATHPDRARSGIGRALFAECAGSAREAGAARFECCASLNAEGFYAALGFRTVGSCEVPMGSTILPCLVMMLEIPAAASPAADQA